MIYPAVIYPAVICQKSLNFFSAAVRPVGNFQTHLKSRMAVYIYIYIYLHAHDRRHQEAEKNPNRIAKQGHDGRAQQNNKEKTNTGPRGEPSKEPEEGPIRDTK